MLILSSASRLQLSQVDFRWRRGRRCRRGRELRMLACGSDIARRSGACVRKGSHTQDIDCPFRSGRPGGAELWSSKESDPKEELEEPALPRHRRGGCRRAPFPIGRDSPPHQGSGRFCGLRNLLLLFYAFSHRFSMDFPLHIASRGHLHVYRILRPIGTLNQLFESLGPYPLRGNFRCLISRFLPLRLSSKTGVAGLKPVVARALRSLQNNILAGIITIGPLFVTRI